MIKTFEDYLGMEFMKGYHGDKDHYENAFDAWLEQKDGNDLIQLAEEAIKFIQNQ